MRVFCSVLLLLLFLAAKATAQPVPVKIRKMNYFYIDGSVSLKPGVNCKVITDEKMFLRMFGRYNRADTPDFENEMILVLLMPASDKESTLSFERVTMQAGDFVEVYCGIDLNHHRIPYTTNAIAVAAIPRFPGIKKLRFFNEKRMRLLDVVPVKE